MKLFKMFGRGKTDEDVEDQLEALGDIEEEDYLDDFDDEAEDKEQSSGQEEEEEEDEEEGEDVVSLEEEKGKAEATGEGGAPAAVQTVAAGPAENADDVMDLFQEEEVEELLPEFLMNQLSDIKGSQLLQECADLKKRLVRS